jgi:hypothetical protein
VAGEFDQAIPLHDLLDAMTEYSAQVADFLFELRARCEPIGRLAKHERMAAPHAHVLVNAVAIHQPDVCVMAKEA